MFGWQGHAYANPEGTRWSHCVITSRQVARDKTDATFALKVHSNLKTDILLYKADWKTTENKKYTLSLQFDDGKPFDVPAWGLGSGGLRIAFDDDSTVPMMLAVAGARGLFVYRGTELLTGFNLKNSTKAVKWLDDCIGDGDAMNGGGKGTDFDAPAKPKINPKTPKLDM